ALADFVARKFAGDMLQEIFAEGALISRAFDEVKSQREDFLGIEAFFFPESLTPLKDFADIEPENKFQLAVAQLKLHSHTLASHRHHPAVELLADLYRNSAYPLSEALRKEKSLDPEEVFSLGFNFVERPGDERTLGKDLLEHIASKFPRNKIGKSAKNKLKLLAR